MKFNEKPPKLVEKETKEISPEIQKREEKLELSEFSKRYSADFRDETARRIRQLRAQYHSKLEDKPTEIESLRIDINKEENLITETKERINRKENSLSHTNEIINRYGEKIRNADELLKETMDFIKEKYLAISEAEQVLDSDFEIKEVKKTISDFYNKIEEQKNLLESEKKERSVAEISKTNDVLFCHAVQISIIPYKSFSENNKTLATNGMSSENKIKMILALEPTISVSTIDKDNQTLLYNFGLILNKGQVLSAYAGDAGTLLNKSIYNRKSKYDRSLETSIIQQEIETNLKNTLSHTEKKDRETGISVEIMRQGWNELVVENPQVAGLFYKKNTPEDNKLTFERAKNISNELQLPLYILNEDKIYEIDTTEGSTNSTNELKEITKEEIFKRSKELSKNKRKNITKEIIDKNTFDIKLENIQIFNGYNTGKFYHSFIKRADKGEKVYMKNLRKDQIDYKNDEIINLFDRIYAIKKHDTTSEEWQNSGKKEWEEHQNYYIIDDSSFKFNLQSPGGAFSLIEPYREKFIMDGDSITSYINMVKKWIEKLHYKNQEKKVNLGDTKNINKIIKNGLAILYGMMEECQKEGDVKNYEEAKNIITTYGNIDEYKRFVANRVGKNGEFQYLEEDIPIEVRRKIKELDG